MYTYTHTYTYIHTYIYIYTYTTRYIYIYVRVSVCVYASTSFLVDACGGARVFVEAPSLWKSAKSETQKKGKTEEE